MARSCNLLLPPAPWDFFAGLLRLVKQLELTSTSCAPELVRVTSVEILPSEKKPPWSPGFCGEVRTLGAGGGGFTGTKKGESAEESVPALAA